MYIVRHDYHISTSSLTYQCVMIIPSKQLPSSSDSDGEEACLQKNNNVNLH